MSVLVSDGQYAYIHVHRRRNTFMLGGAKTCFAVQDGYFIYYLKLAVELLMQPTTLNIHVYII